MNERAGKILYGPLGSETELVFTLPPKAWLPVDSAVGGSLTAAGGIPASYVVRRDRLLQLTLRLYETEWSAVRAWLVWGQSAASFFWYRAAGDASPIECYLESPLAGEQIAPTREAGFPRVLLLDVTFRGVGSADPWSPYFQMAGA